MDRGGGDAPERLAIARLDAAAAEFSKSSHHLEALECMEKAMVVRIRVFGPRSEETWTAARNAGELCNLLALSFMQKEAYAKCAELLKKAEVLTERDGAGRAVTHNNWACLMRQQGKLNVALAHLRKALALEESLPKEKAAAGATTSTPSSTIADTHLNICAVLSQLHRHTDALVHAKSALDLLQEEVFGGLSERAAKAPGGLVQAARMAGVTADRVASLCIAYHNFGVECEFERTFTPALQAYTKGFELAKAFLGAEHGVTVAIQESQVAAAKTIKLEAIKAKKELAAKEAAAASAAVAAIGGGEGGGGGGKK